MIFEIQYMKTVENGLNFLQKRQLQYISDLLLFAIHSSWTADLKVTSCIFLGIYLHYFKG